MKLTPIPAERVDTVWHWCGPLIARACQHTGGQESAEDLHAKVKRGMGYILATIDDDAALVLERSDHCLHVVSIGGHSIVSRLNEFLDALYIVAGYVGAKGVSYKGRKGWGRLLAPHGFRDMGNGFMEVSL